MKKIYHLFSLSLVALLGQGIYAQCVETNLAQNTGNSVGGHTTCGQIFTASCTGNIVSVTVVYNTATTGPNDRILNIRDGALPTSPIIHTQVIPFSSMVVGTNVFTLTTPVPINMSEVNAWEITDATMSSTACNGISFNSGGAYGGGDAWFSGSILTNYDLTFEVEISNAIIVDLGPDTTICPGESLVLDAGPGGVSYDWSTGDTTQTIVVSTADTYSVTVVDSNANTVVDDIIVDLYTVVPVDLGGDATVCAGDTACFDAGTSGVSYLWNNGVTSSIMCADSATTYAVTVTDANGCDAMDSVDIIVIQYPVAMIDSIDFSNCENVGFFDGSSNATSVSWSFGDGNTSTMNDPTNTYVYAGSYDVVLTATNSCGTDSTTQTITLPCFSGISEWNQWNVSIYPNPNSGIFTLELNGTNESSISVEIYSMAGELVFSNSIYGTGLIKTPVDLSDLNSGIYTLKLTSGEQNLTERIVISK